MKIEMAEPLECGGSPPLCIRFSTTPPAKDYESAAESAQPKI
jgi:hypothetical protein